MCQTSPMKLREEAVNKFINAKFCRKVRFNAEIKSKNFFSSATLMREDTSEQEGNEGNVYTPSNVITRTNFGVDDYQ